MKGIVFRSCYNLLMTAGKSLGEYVSTSFAFAKKTPKNHLSVCLYWAAFILPFKRSHGTIAMLLHWNDVICSISILYVGRKVFTSIDQSSLLMLILHGLCQSAGLLVNFYQQPLYSCHSSTKTWFVECLTKGFPVDRLSLLSCGAF